MAINIAYLEVRLSGGSGNTDPDLSLGGDMSSERVLSQSASGITNITGVTIAYASGNAVGAGTLAFNATGDTLTWTPNGGSAGAAVPVGADGKYTILGSAGFLLVTVVAASLPVGNQSDAITIANIANETFDDVTKAESFAGDVEYRCLYLTNTHDTDPFLDVVAFVPFQPTPGAVAIGADPNGVGDGVTRSVTSITRSSTTATATTGASHGYTSGQTVRVSGADQAAYNGSFVITVTGVDTFTYTVAGSPPTPATGTLTVGRGVATLVGNESTAPAGVTFSAPATESPDGISLGELQPGETVAIWERRTIPERNTTSNAESECTVQFQTYY